MLQKRIYETIVFIFSGNKKCLVRVDLIPYWKFLENVKNCAMQFLHDAEKALTK